MIATLATLVAFDTETTPLLARQRTVALVLALVLTVAVFELVRRRKLREEYSVVWIAVGIGRAHV